MLAGLIGKIAIVLTETEAPLAHRAGPVVAPDQEQGRAGAILPPRDRRRPELAEAVKLGAMCVLVWSHPGLNRL